MSKCPKLNKEDKAYLIRNIPRSYIDSLVDSVTSTLDKNKFRLKINDQDKHERCIIKLKHKQSDYCAANKYKAYLFDPTTGKTCYNPFMICSHVY